MSKATREVTIRVVVHLLVWAVLLSLPLYTAKRLQLGSNFLLLYYSYTMVNGLLFYTNYLLLVPKLFFQKKRIKYYLSALALIACFYYISDISNALVLDYLEKVKPEGYQKPIPFPPGGMRLKLPLMGPHMVSYLSSSLFVVFLSLGIKVLEHQFKIEKIQEEVEKAKLNAELAILKNQISPHFFFNTLNNIHYLIGKNNEDSKNAVIKLSRLMRYAINESGQDNKPLSDEIDFMNNYIDLMKLRVGAKTNLNINFPTEYFGLLIPHLLFISLVENAFKYGISVQEESFINISLACSENGIIFKCENGVQPGNYESLLTSSGIGLENLKKRLSLIYPNRHTLEIKRTKDRFEVNLTIQP